MSVKIICVAFYLLLNTSDCRSRNEVQEKKNIQYKCCPVNVLYNYEYKSCGPKTIARALIKQSHVHKFPKCIERDEVLVELSSEKSNFIIYNNNSVTVFINPVAIYNTKSYCEEILKKPWIKVVYACLPRRICDHMSCITRCCGHGAKPNDKRCPVDEPERLDVNFSIISAFGGDIETVNTNSLMFGIRNGLKCSKGLSPSIWLQPWKYNDHQYYINSSNGVLYLPKQDKRISGDSYCFRYSIKKKMNVAYVCPAEYLEDYVHESEYKICFYALIGVSITSLTSILVIYLGVPKLHERLHGKIIIAYVFSLLLSCILIVIGRYKIGECRVLSYITYFSCLSVIAWLNVISCDVFVSIRSVRYTLTVKNSQDSLYFRRYALYAYSVPLILTFFVFIVDKLQYFHYSKRPHLGEIMCWFTPIGSDGDTLYFMTPIGIQLTINLILYIWSAVEYRRINLNVKCNRPECEMDRERVRTNVKLFLLMGIFWLFGIILSSLRYPVHQMFFLENTVYMLQMVLLFGMFVCQRSVWLAVKERFHHIQERWHCFSGRSQ